MLSQIPSARAGPLFFSVSVWVNVSPGRTVEGLMMVNTTSASVEEFCPTDDWAAQPAPGSGPYESMDRTGFIVGTSSALPCTEEEEDERDGRLCSDGLTCLRVGFTTGSFFTAGTLRGVTFFEVLFRDAIAGDVRRDATV